ncbi:unnamed protein product [Acanthoscelides obtectus]|uniref:Gamma-secretase-activating protein C-terminal domain-containing protein n=1 Tax=Acanthoscelides obtectus TaxID=200917 RepID=A0A9P0LTQ7_ACAOB|nr:unnamed protein product [Acanthoscelides obtectus]CAK1671554.1 Protein pigeon [Acanthoscelides obtectus]
MYNDLAVSYSYLGTRQNKKAFKTSFLNVINEFNEWKPLGQERDGSFIFSWVHTKEQESRTHIGIYEYDKNLLSPVYSFPKKVNCTQASTNSDKTLLAFVIKETDEETKESTYKPYLYKIGTHFDDAYDWKLERNRQIMVQFLYPRVSVLSENQPAKLLVLVHHEYIFQYQVKLKTDNIEDDCLSQETLVGKFLWAQWDPEQQTLYYIHNRKRNRIIAYSEGEEESNAGNDKITPTLSGLQFNDEVPHETVLNIPLNLPHLTVSTSSCLIYEDDAIPLRIHDCSLDLIVLTDPNGIVCVCHHYLYQPIQPVVDLKDEDSSPVHFAYSVTVLHQSCVLHCVIPDIPWNKAKKIRPLFKIEGDHLLIIIPDICTHLLDIGLIHEPCCHVTTKPLITETQLLYLAPIVPLEHGSVLNLANLDLISLEIPTNMLVDTFKSDTLLENKLSILHYLILHSGHMDTASELILWQSERPFTLGYPQMLKEYLIATSYAAVQRTLPTDANKLINLLPITSQKIGFEYEIQQDEYIINLSQDVLWNASMMLLSPQQRIVPYRTDIWVKLWEQLAKLSKGTQRFKPSQVVEKLMVSLVCYQPEVLSRCSTPLSPSGGASSTLNDFLSNQCNKRNQVDALPFFEIDSCTASKQEHIISVNLRELSMHLLKQSTENRMNKWQWQSQTPMHVHAVATRYITAQLDQSRQLCQLLCKAATYEPRLEMDKGFIFM